MTHSMEPSGYLSERPSSQSPWRWVLLDAAGADVSEKHDPSGRELRFTSQGDAESWIGESWRVLVEAGVDAVTLLEGDREVYGPMSLQT
jgi:hypothetical protein